MDDSSLRIFTCLVIIVIEPMYGPDFFLKVTNQCTLERMTDPVLKMLECRLTCESDTSHVDSPVADLTNNTSDEIPKKRWNFLSRTEENVRHSICLTSSPPGVSILHRIENESFWCTRIKKAQWATHTYTYRIVYRHCIRTKNR